MKRGTTGSRSWIPGILLATVLAGPAWPQWTQTLGQRGFVPGASFDPSTITSVNMINGNALTRIPLTAMPLGHAGMSVDIALTYNSTGYDGSYNYQTSKTMQAYSADLLLPTATGDALEQWGYGYNYGLTMEFRGPGPSGGCVVTAGTPPTVNFGASDPSALYPWRLRAVFPDGSLHVLHLSNSPPPGSDAPNIEDFESGIATGWLMYDAAGIPSGCEANESTAKIAGPLHYFTLDGTYVRVDITTLDDSDCSSSKCSWTMRFPDGRVVMGQGFFASSISDRNANTVTITRSAATPCYLPLHTAGDPVTVIEDDFGRCIQIENALSDSGSFTDYITQAGYGYDGTPNVWTLAGTAVPATFGYEYGLGQCQIGYETQCNSLGGEDFSCSGQGVICQPQSFIPAFTSVQLPLTGQSYSFGFTNSAGLNCLVQTQGSYTPNCQGQLTQVTLPIGSAISYGAAQIQYKFDAPGTCGMQRVASSCDPQDMPITSKTLTHHDPSTSDTLTDSWTYSIGYPISSQQSSVTNPDGGMVNHYFLYPYGGSPFAGLTFEIDQPDGSLVQQTWQNNSVALQGNTIAGNPFVQAEYRSVANLGTPALTAAANYSYDNNGNVLQVGNYDWIGYPFTANGHNPITAPPALPSVTRTATNTYPLVVATTGSNAQNGYWNPSAPNLLNAKTSTLVTEASPPTSSKSTYSEFIYDSATSTGNVTQEWNWDSTKSPSFPGQMSSGTGSGNLNSSNAVGFTRTYNSGDLSMETDPRSITKIYTYGSSGMCAPYPSALSEGSGARHWSFTWDCYTGLRTSETDVDNGTTTTAGIVATMTPGYDVIGRPLNITRPNGQQTNTSYSDATQTVTVKTDLSAPADGSMETVKSLDDLGRVWQTQETSDVTGCSFITTQSLQRTIRGTGSYQLASNPYCVAGSDTTMGWTLTTLDTMGRVTSVGHYSGQALPSPWPGGSNSNSTGIAQTGYGASTSGSTTTVTDEAGVSRTLTSDGLGRLKQVTDSSGTTTYGYSLDNLTSVTQSGQSRSFSYSSLGRLLTAINPETGTSPVQYAYDPDGNLTARQDTRGISLTETYNTLNQPIQKTYSDGTPTVTYAYSSCGSYSGGRLCSVSNSVSSTSYTYDIVGRFASSTQSTGSNYQFSYQYNLNDGMTQEVYPSGRTVSYVYNGAGRVRSVTGQAPQSGPTTNYVSGVTYAPQHAMSSLSLANGLLSESWVYNSRLQASQIQAGSLLTLGYGYAPTTNNGNVTSATILPSGGTTINQAFGYDGLNRLSAAVENASPCSSSFSDWCQQFGYDAYGNRTAQSYGQGVSSLTPQSFSSITNRIADVNWNYDAAGNVILQPGPDSYVYDAENRQTAFCSNVSTCSVSGATMAYSYDGDGKRVQTSGSSVMTTFVYDANGQLAAEYGSSPPPCSTCYLTADALGSTRMITDQTGACVQRYDYLPFGQNISVSSGNPRFGVSCYSFSSTPVRQEFTGQLRDSETSNDFFLARYYSSPQGRFTSPDGPFNDQDPSDPQSWNLYTYVRNNPLNSTDPDGTCATSAGVSVPCPGDGTVNVTDTLEPIPYLGGDPSLLRVLHGILNGVAPIVQQSQQFAQAAIDWIGREDWNCVSGATVTGTFGGAATGAALGLAGGPAAPATAPAGALVGSGYGFGSGLVGGLAMCNQGGGQGSQRPGGSGSGRASGSEARLTRPQQRQTAEYLGMKEVKGLVSQGQLVFEKGGRYFSFSNTSHIAGEVFKELDRSGDRIPTTDLNLNRIAP